jgi:hypothetical protein
MSAWLETAGLLALDPVALEGDPLTVVLWSATHSDQQAGGARPSAARFAPSSARSRFQHVDESQVA